MAPDDVRRKEIRDADAKELLMKTRYLWLYSPEKLPEKYRERYGALKESDLRTARACAISENLRNLWNCSTVDEVKEFWRKWYW